MAELRGPGPHYLDQDGLGPPSTGPPEQVFVSIPLDGAQQTKVRQFYPPLILQQALHRSCNEKAKKTMDTPTNPYQGAEEKFSTFVNKLAHICDYRPHGDTITALAVMENHGHVTYVFASNSREVSSLPQVERDITGILNLLKDNLEAETRVEDQVLYDRLFRRILVLNETRLKSYLNRLLEVLDKCIATAQSQNEEITCRALEELRQQVPRRESVDAGDDYISSTASLIQILSSPRHSALRSAIEKHAATTRLNPITPWSTLQHICGRLLSYQYDAETLISAHHIWSETDLFRNFTVRFLPSSGSYPAKALKCKTETPETIIKRMAGVTPQVRSELVAHAAVLQESYGLTKALDEQWRRAQGLDPIVHAEVLVYDWIVRTTGGAREERFFNHWRYIGTSKPLCRLCQYYFAMVNQSGVRFRDGHPNTYLNWRLPDVYADERDKDAVIRARKAWREAMDGMKARVYDDLRRLLVEKATVKKQNDSNTFTDGIMLEGLLGGLRLE